MKDPSACVLVPGVDSADSKVSPIERSRAAKWVSHQAQSIVRKATLVLMVRAMSSFLSECRFHSGSRSISLVLVLVVLIALIQFELGGKKKAIVVLSLHVLGDMSVEKYTCSSRNYRSSLLLLFR